MAPGAALQLGRQVAMDADRNSRALIRWSGVLAACGALVALAATAFLAAAIWQDLLIDSDSPTHVFVPPALTACFVVASAVVLIASTFVRHIANHRRVALAKRRSLIAMIGTLAGWLTVGVTVLLLARR